MFYFSKKLKGFTLVETLVVIFVFSIIMLGVTLLLKNIFVNSTQQQLSLETVDQGRIILFNFNNELRNAKAGNDGSYALNQAGDAQIIFYSTYGSATSTQAVKIRYYISGTTLFKGVTAPSGNPPSYNPASEVLTALTTNLNNGSTTPLFYYYDGNYSGTSSPLSQPINVNNVKYAVINLVLPKQDVRGSTTTFKLSAGSTIRNIKTNLGN